jgi:hypothetical protein
VPVSPPRRPRRHPPPLRPPPTPTTCSYDGGGGTGEAVAGGGFGGGGGGRRVAGGVPGGRWRTADGGWRLEAPRLWRVGAMAAASWRLQLGMAIGRVIHGYIVRESIPTRQNSTHTRTHKRSWVWICIHTRTRRVSAIQWIPITRSPTTILALNTKQQFYYISK